jgi:hypothetical protein
MFNGDPDGDFCGTKRIGSIYAERDKTAAADEFIEAVAYSLASIHNKIEYWRKNA